MKLRISILLFLLTSVITVNISAQDSREEKFRQGVESFSGGNYNKALELWTDVYNTGYRSAELEYNIANAYFKLSNIPAAILFYERARLLKPADEDINYNLQIARTLTVDRFIEIPELFFVKWFKVVSLLLSTNTWAKISLIAFALSLFFLSVYFYTARYKFKVLGFWLAILLFIVSVLSVSFSASNNKQIHHSQFAIVFSPQVSGKSSPDKSGTDLFILHEGTKVRTGEKVGDWFEIRLSDGNKGWVPASGIQII
jgi:tetratricopeptide (TPR) repeat protein